MCLVVCLAYFTQNCRPWQLRRFASLISVQAASNKDLLVGRAHACVETTLACALDRAVIYHTFSYVIFAKHCGEGCELTYANGDKVEDVLSAAQQKAAVFIPASTHLRS
eukprot:6173222-Pleurochrysis_carterae.AAC.6